MPPSLLGRGLGSALNNHERVHGHDRQLPESVAQAVQDLKVFKHGYCPELREEEFSQRSTIRLLPAKKHDDLPTVSRYAGKATNCR